MTVVFDTYALVKFLKKEEGYLTIRKALEEGGYVSDATLYELFYVVSRDFIQLGFLLEETLLKAQEIIDSLSYHLKKEAITISIMKKSTYFRIKYSKLNLSHFDCIALATASEFNLPLLSGDKGLAKVQEVTVL
ncbi:PIN domain-containing protein [Candidatus Woesearchaeota archaeon]|nr:PIN domain-containing protein [Candidatus Woesearchaeota archaeon]